LFGIGEGRFARHVLEGIDAIDSPLVCAMAAPMAFATAKCGADHLETAEVVRHENAAAAHGDDRDGIGEMRARSAAAARRRR
jgi:hypothetical protein